jgi:hypothetical protein
MARRVSGRLAAQHPVFAFYFNEKHYNHKLDSSFRWNDELLFPAPRSLRLQVAHSPITIRFRPDEI